MERITKIGSIPPKASSQVKNSRLGLGFEKLDRALFEPDNAYDKVAELGVKWIRLQSGWARTETQKGVYDFSWLDSIVDNLIRRGLKPWFCLCYGNGLYNERAAEVFGCVGVPPIFSQKEKDAWIAYVKATVRHFEGRIDWFEIWNEPDGIWCWKHGVSPEEYGDFARDTAKAIKETNPNVKVIGLSQCMRSLHWANGALSRGMCDYIDAITFHEYTADESLVFERAKAMKSLVRAYNPNILVIQGESGSQSKYSEAGALNRADWTERKQAKQLLRHTVADLISDVYFASYFSTLDMVEALNGKADDLASYLDYAYFGVLGAEFDEKGVATGEYFRKPSFYALQNLASIFSEEIEVYDLPVIFHPTKSNPVLGEDCKDKTILSGGFRRVGKDGKPAFAFAYWNSLDLMTTEFEGTVTLQLAAPCGEYRPNLADALKLIDPYDGSVYRLSKNFVDTTPAGTVTLRNLPLKDYPLILTVGEFVL